VQAVFTAFNRRPIAGTGLVIAAAWVAFVATQCFTVSPWDTGGWYAHMIETVDFAWRGVVGVVALAWLLEQVFA
jgi:hypothetical protein